MTTLLGWIVGLAVFGLWMSIVGNPHVVETAIGLVLGVGAGWWARNFFKRIGEKFKKKSA